MRMKYVLAPGWVEDAFKMAGKPLSECIDPKALTSTLSKRDVVFYLLSQYLAQKVFAPFGEEDGGMYNVDFYDIFRMNADVINPFDIMSNMQLELGEPKAEWLLGITNQRTVDNEGKLPQGYANDDWTFDSIYLKENIILIRPKLINKEYDINDQNIEAYSQLINIMNQFLPFEAIASTGIFRHYTKLVRYSGQAAA